MFDADATAADRITTAGNNGRLETAGAGTRPVPAGPPWPVADYDPRFVNNPDAIAKAKAIYDGTYQG